MPKSSRKPTQPSTRNWDLSEESRRLLKKARSTTAELRALATFPDDAEVPSALHRKSPVPAKAHVNLRQLAWYLRTSQARAQVLIDRGYLRVMQTEPEVIVALPEKHAMYWLRSMFQPFIIRPLLPTQYVARFLDIEEWEVRSLCVDHSIVLIDDPVFGELLSIYAFYRLHDALDRKSVV